MGELKNEFSWSFSRHSMLATCARRYYFQHYASWGGWERDAPPEVREIYRLKQLTSRPGWKGTVIHDAIADALRRARAGRPVEDVDACVASVLESMRRDYRESRDDVARRTGDFKHHVRFLEHEQDEGRETESQRRAWKEAAGDVETGLRNFFGSRLHAHLRSLGPADWVEIEEAGAPPGSFHVDGVKVWVKLDCAYRDGGRIVVVDWKTGRRSSSLTPVQLATYALYVADLTGRPPEDVRAREVNVVLAESREHDVGAEALDAFHELLTRSVSRMRSLLADPAENVPRPAAEFAFTEDERDCRWCNYRSVCPRVSPAF